MSRKKIYCWMILAVSPLKKPDRYSLPIWSFSCSANKSVLVFLVVAPLLLVGCGLSGPQTYVINGSTMGTYYTVKLVSRESIKDSELDDLEHDIAKSLGEINSLMSSYDDDSEISRFNRAPIATRFGLSTPTFEVLSQSVDIYNLTDGAFDISVSPLIELWGFGASDSPLETPTRKAVDLAKANVGLNQLTLDLSDSTATKLRPVQINVSAIAKGYAVDRVANFLNQFEPLGFLVEVGGEIRASGYKASGDPWRVGIEVPTQSSRSSHTTLALKNRSIATSGDYRNYIDLEGVRYSHTLDPRTGYPVEHKVTSVSVLADTCAQADALATALMVMGETEGLAFAAQNNLDTLFIVKAGDGFVNKATGGLKALVN